jgi:hypothetical protein
MLTNKIVQTAIHKGRFKPVLLTNWQNKVICPLDRAQCECSMFFQRQKLINTTITIYQSYIDSIRLRVNHWSGQPAGRVKISGNVDWSSGIYI